MMADREKIPVDYDSPLEIYYVEQMAYEIARAVDDGVMKAVVKAGIDIDKEKLAQALQQDNERYADAYRKGYMAGYEKRENDIVRCKDCKHWESKDGRYGFCKICHSKESSNGWFCADGERQEDCDGNADDD